MSKYETHITLKLEVRRQRDGEVLLTSRGSGCGPVSIGLLSMSRVESVLHAPQTCILKFNSLSMMSKPGYVLRVHW